MFICFLFLVLILYFIKRFVDYPQELDLCSCRNSSNNCIYQLPRECIVFCEPDLTNTWKQILHLEEAIWLPPIYKYNYTFLLTLSLILAAKKKSPKNTIVSLYQYILGLINKNKLPIATTKIISMFSGTV